MPESPAKRARRVTDKVVSPYVAGLADHLTAVHQSVLDLHARIGGLEAQIGDIASALATDRQILRDLSDRADEQRLRLYELRRSDDYGAAFTEEEPLVSFVVPTFDRFESLRDVSLPSILGQTYRNLEVIVAGDCSPEETATVVRELDDSRVRFINRTVRGPYPTDPEQRWFMVGTPPLNDGVAQARGRWIAILGDDDEVLPGHTELLLRAAREQRLEFPYGRLTVKFGDGSELELGKFPPEYGHFTLQFGIYHAGLRFFQFEPADALYAEANDWSLARRMVAAGVRFGMIDDLVAIKNESRTASRQAWLGEATAD
ncbi:MAG TPA: glycosyltransferase family 2 protein [Solirubrobacterales bacterium]|nr:glycosyltransferase family 2 protein [Solirubrobacterales bacterium]